MQNAMKTLRQVDGLPQGAGFGICYGPNWTLAGCNGSVASFLKLDDPDSISATTLISVLYRLEYAGAADCIKQSKAQEAVVFQAGKDSYAFIWSYIAEEQKISLAQSLNLADKDIADLRNFFLLRIPDQPAHKGRELLWQELKIILDSVHDGIWMIDNQGITVHVNKALCSIAGLKAEDVIGKHVSVPMEEGIFTSCVTLTALEKKAPITLFDDYASGKRCLNTSTPIFDEAGNIWRVVASIRDMSELEEAQFRLAEAEREARFYKDKLEKKHQPQSNGFIGNSPTMRKCIRKLEKAAKVPSGVLILGETGTGKTLAASFVHQKSQRAGGPFVSVNCAAIPSTLLESELFGYEKGAFTGAAQEGKKGFFELADTGTIFLDEIGELPLTMQAKLLHVLDSLSFHRVGGTKKIQVDVRILAATNKPLEELVRKKEFRDDLYYRLRVLSVQVPPLRDRPEDISSLAMHFLEEACVRHGTNKIFDPKVLQRFSVHNWPGNVRELQATVEFLAAMAEGNIIKLRDLPAYMDVGSFSDEEQITLPETHNLKEAVQHLEQKLISNALMKTGSTYKAAALLGVSQSTVVRKAQKLQISVPE